ncbi:zona pellucida sperm-binding protein 1 isoform X1 [Prionailurus bengalensis]|uniref:zona pellucida sperm-binding protein 1 isoform X1 n=1 Tax=Prionailurus bengalensis TaxID=37029 RepID=UPI001CA8CB97|nr:zona pellucida sperm-binding protein 1 isoform X1 [Prionailurus bengalensis]XP_043437200.1 zona pellucida sperm-binding protein 1 isoform X1 [Prionailurus bengalensis]
MYKIPGPCDGDNISRCSPRWQIDEFGNQFEVHNCSVCYHWVTVRPLGPAVFSADYRGCHVLEKDGRFHLRVFVEAVLRDGRVDAAGEVTLICPKPGHTWTPESHLASRTGFSLPTPHTRPLRPTQEHSFTRPTPALLPLRPGATRPTLTLPQWDILEHWGVDEPLHPGAPLTWEQCQVPSGHIPCVVRRGSKEACQKAGCCYDNSRAVPCYYGNTATVQCFRNGHFVLVVSQETALAHGITLANIHVAYAPTSCSPTQDTGSFVVFQFPLTHCGTTVQVVGNQLLYENQLVSDIDIRMGPQGSITRDGAFRLHVRCTVNASDFLPLRASIFPPPWPAPVIQSGPLRFQLRIATDETFRSFYEEGDYPIVRLLREPVSVEVRLLDRTDPGLVLLLHRCWATPSASPFQQPQWPILSEGCPFDGDSYRTRMVASDGAGLSFPSHHQRFTVTTFALLDPGSQRALRGQVYFFCHSSACSPSGLETCSTTCSSRPARQRRSYTPHGEATRPQNLVSSPGPVDFEDSSGQEPPLGPTGSPRNANQRPLLWVVLLLVAVALVLGVGVFVGLSQAKPRSSRRATEGDWAQ